MTAADLFAAEVFGMLFAVVSDVSAAEDVSGLISTTPSERPLRTSVP